MTAPNLNPSNGSQGVTTATMVVSTLLALVAVGALYWAVKNGFGMWTPVFMMAAVLIAALCFSFFKRG